MKDIFLKNIVPAPLRDEVQNSDVWGKECPIHRGRYYVITADSGRGKSTLLHILYGIRRDYTGEANVLGRDIRNIPGRELSHIRQTELAFLFQDLRLFGSLSARENILMKPGYTAGSAEMELMADRLGMTRFLDKPCEKLSLGQQQRIALIRALGQPFSFLFLDEPFSHLDQANATAAMKLIIEICERNKAGIIATSLGDNRGFEGFEEVKL